MVRDSLKQHLLYSLVLGLALRLICLHFVWGPMALDDYLDNIIPAWKFMSGHESGLHDYRSPLYFYILAGWLKLGLLFGVEKGISQIQWVYFLQALSSLLCFWGVYLWVKEWADQRAARIALYLLAAQAFMPFASTRSFMESFAMGFLTLGVVFLALSEKSDGGFSAKNWWGWILLGFSILVRFQIGVLYIGWGIFLLARKRYKQCAAGILVGFGLILAEALIDKSFGRYPFQSLHDYFAFNADQSRAAVMPWYDTWLAWLGGATFFPFSLIFVRRWWPSIKENLTLFFPVLVYVVVHSLYPHKEERYMFPILPLTMVFLARAFSLAAGDRYFRWVYRPLFWTLTALTLCLTCLVNTQYSLVGIYGETQMQSDRVLYLDYDFIETRDWIGEFFTRGTSIMVHPKSAISKEAVESLWKSYPELKKVVLISSAVDSESQLLATQMDLAHSYSCSQVLRAETVTDRILYQLNPKFNYRRQTAQYFSCDRL
jgi:hypothetical protein